MPFDQFHTSEEITDARRKAVAKSIRTIDVAELKKLREQIFDAPDHPWRAKFFQLIENPGATFYHADAGEGVIFLYDTADDKGLWCLPASGMGPLSATGPRDYETSNQATALIIGTAAPQFHCNS